MTWKQKLNPRRFSDMSPKMQAIVGFICDIKYTTPAISAMIVTSDDFVLAQLEGDIGFNEFIGAESDLMQNWYDLLTAAGLTSEQRALANVAYLSHIRNM